MTETGFLDDPYPRSQALNVGIIFDSTFYYRENISLEKFFATTYRVFNEMLLNTYELW